MQRLFIGDVRDHRRKGGRLARSGRSGHQHQPVGDVRQIADGERQLERVDAQDLDRDAAEHGAHRAALHVQIGSESGYTGHAVAEVD